MKYKFVKNAFGYKADSEVELTADEAKAFGDAVVEVKAEVGDVTAKAVEELLSAVDAKIDAFEKKIAKGINSRKPTIHVGPDNADLDPQKGFKGFGDFATAVRKACMGNEDIRLKVPSGASEGTAADGGYAVPTIYADQIFNDIQSGPNFLPLTTNFPLTVGNTLKVPADATTVIGTSGVTAAWIGEGVSISTSKPALRQLSLTPYKVASLVYVTDELLTDNNAALENYLVGKASYALNYAINNAIIRGNGSSKPTGIIGHAATAQQIRNTVNNVKLVDVANMKARFYGDESKARWVMNREVWQQLAQMTVGNFPAWLPENTAFSAPMNMLFGSPVIVSEHSSTLGVVGDIMYGDFSKYYTATIGGVNSAVSMHIKFDTQELAYRWTFRIDGIPARATLLTPASGQGTATLSPFVVLGAGTTGGN